MNEFDRNLHEDIAAGEAWLDGFDTPSPSAEMIVRCKLAVRAELGMPQANGRRWLRLKHWHGAVAAAAMIMLAVTIGWESYDRYDARAVSPPQVGDEWYVWVAPAQDDSDSAQSLYEDIAEETDELGDWSLSGGGLFAAFEDSGNVVNEEATDKSDALRWQPSAGETLKGVV